MNRECRLDVFATTHVLKGRGRKRHTVAQHVAWQDWNDNPFQERRHGRLKGSGSFYWPGPRAAYRRAVVLLRRDPTIVGIRIQGIGAQEVGYVRRGDVAPSFGCHPGQLELVARF